MMDKNLEDKPSFIAEARRAQIFEATIAALDEVGYLHASMTQIAKRAGISPALISYHFRDKNDLMDYTLVKLLTDRTAYVLERTDAVASPSDKLKAYIEAGISYQAGKPACNTALIEIVFHARTADNVPYYKLNDDEEDSLESELHRILQTGQRQGEFGEFDVQVMASSIRGAIDEYAFNGKLKGHVDPRSYGMELVKLFNRAVRRD